MRTRSGTLPSVIRTAIGRFPDGAVEKVKFPRLALLMEHSYLCKRACARRPLERNHPAVSGSEQDVPAFALAKLPRRFFDFAKDRHNRPVSESRIMVLVSCHDGQLVK